MRGVSSRFLSTLRGSHLAVFRARVCPPGQTGIDPDGTEIPVTGGEVVFSDKADVRATLTLNTTMSWPASSSGLLTPYGNEIYVERGLTYGNSQTEYVGLGYFRIDTPEQEQVPNGEIVISGQDRTAQVIDERWLQPFRAFRADLTWLQTVERLVGEVWPGVPIEFEGIAAGYKLARTVMVTEHDRYALLKKYLQAWGRVGYFDHRGVYVVKPVPSINAAPVWTIDSGANGVLVEMSRALTREGIYNGVAASGEATDQGSPAYAAVVNRSGPTRWGGPFGRVPRFLRSPFITTNQQAREAAAGLLRKSIGLPYQVELAAVPNAALEPGDVVKVRYPSTGTSRSLTTERHILDEVRVPLSVDAPVQLSTRQQAGEDIGDVDVSE